LAGLRQRVVRGRALRQVYQSLEDGGVVGSEFCLFSLDAIELLKDQILDPLNRLDESGSLKHLL
jgi:hypothetical protein